MFKGEIMPSTTVKYEIEPNGDCSKCESKEYIGDAKDCSTHICLPFNKRVWGLIQCQACKDFLAKEAELKKVMLKLEGMCEQKEVE